MTDISVRKRLRLNPFAFPPETNGRFTLLVVAALLLAFEMGSLLLLLVNIDLGGYGEMPVPDYSTRPSGLVYIAEHGKSLMRPVLSIGLQGAFVIAVLALGLMVYLAHPFLLRNKKRLRRITRQDDPLLVDAVHALAQQIRIFPSPQIEIGAESTAMDGQAFGLQSPFSLRLGERLRLLLRKKPDAFRAIVLHELAHIANGDVTRAYYAQAIWIAFVICIITPLLALIIYNFADSFFELITGAPNFARWIRLFTTVLPSLGLWLVNISFCVVILAAIRAGLLRARETYADWSAALWGGEAALVEILRRNVQSVKPWWPWHLLRLHPTPQERLEVLGAPERLFRITSELPFFVGILIAFILIGTNDLLLNLATFTMGFNVISMVVLLDIFNYRSFGMQLAYIITSGMNVLLILSVFLIMAWIFFLVVRSLGMQVQREAVADLSLGRSGGLAYLKLWRPAAWLAVGFQLGMFFAPTGSFDFIVTLQNSRLSYVYLVAPILTVVLAGLGWLWLAYTRFFSLRLLGSHLGPSIPHTARRLLIAASTAVLLVVYSSAWAIPEIYSANTAAEMEMLAQWWRFFFFALLGGLLFYGLLFAATWLVVQILQVIQHPHCSTCGAVVSGSNAVGQVCPSCGNELAPWLFVNAPPVSNAPKF